MNYLTIRKHLLLLSILLELSFPVSSQKKSELTLGIALPEMLNAGFKYGTDFQVGGAVGFMPVINFLTLTGGIFYNFPGKTGKTNPDSWNINLGGTFIDIIKNDRVIAFYSRLGRRLNFKNGSGLNIDFGLGVFQSREAGLKPSARVDVSLPRSISVNPVGGISYFIKF